MYLRYTGTPSTSETLKFQRAGKALKRSTDWSLSGTQNILYKPLGSKP